MFVETLFVVAIYIQEARLGAVDGNIRGGFLLDQELAELLKAGKGDNYQIWGLKLESVGKDREAQGWFRGS